MKKTHLFSIKERLGFMDIKKTVDACQKECFIDWIKNLKIPLNSIGLSVSVGSGVWDYLVLSNNSKVKKIIATDIVENPVDKNDIKDLTVLGEWEFKKVFPEKPLPFKNESFNLIFHQDVIEHVEKPFLFIQEQYRVLKKGGILIFGTPNLLRPSNFINLMLGRFTFPLVMGNSSELGTLIHKQEFYEQQLKILAEEVGFKKIEVKQCFFGIHGLHLFFSKFPESKLGKSMCHYLMFKCVK